MNDAATKAAVIGLGSMGLGIAQSLRRAGFDVIGCDLREPARAALREAGARVVARPDAIDADCPVVISVVVNSEQTDAVLFSEHGVAPRLAPGSLLIACSTVAPAYAQAAAARAQALGLHYLDAPISGGAVKAAAGALSVMASGSPAAFERGAAALEAMAEHVWRLGDAPGQGSSMKLVNQLLAGVHIAASAEAMALAIKMGLDPRTVYDVICRSAGMSWMFENRVPRILEAHYEPHSAVDIFVKDFGIVLDTAARNRFPTPLSATAHQLFTMASSAGLGGLDDSAVAKVYERLSDIELPRGDGD